MAKEEMRVRGVEKKMKLTEKKAPRMKEIALFSSVFVRII